MRPFLILGLAFISLLSLADFSKAATLKSPFPRVVLFRGEDCLSLDVFPTDDEVTLECQDGLKDVAKPMQAFNKFQSGEATCAVGDFKSFYYINGDASSFGSLVVQNDAATCGSKGTCSIQIASKPAYTCQKINSSCQAGVSTLQIGKTSNFRCLRK